MSRTAVFALAALAALAAQAHAQTVPAKLSFAGRLTDTGGTPLSGPQNLEFRLYAALTGGTAVWSEEHAGAAAVDGMLFVELGRNTPLDAYVFDGGERFLEIRVAGGALSPRLPIASVPYALRADVASLLGPYGPEDVQERVTGSCAAGSSIRAIAADGTVSCEIDDAGTGDITGVAAGTGLVGGGSAGDVSLSVDTTVIQRRIGATCAAGSSIRAIAADGAVTCETDDVGAGDITGVAAGTGLSGGGAAGDVSLSVDTTVIQRRVGATCAVGSSIRAIGVDGTVTCEIDDVGAGDITGVAAGSGLTGGGTAGDVSLSIAADGVGMAHVAVPLGSRPTGMLASIGTSGYVGWTPEFIAPGNGACMVISTATVQAPQYSSGFGTLYTAARINGVDQYDQGYGVNLGESVVGSSWVSGTAAHVFPVTAGQRVQFGCFLWNTGVYVNQTYHCRAAYMCM
jgi:hypothetical protein